MEGTTGTARESSTAAHINDEENRKKYSEDEIKAREAIQDVLEHPRAWI